MELFWKGTTYRAVQSSIQRSISWVQSRNLRFTMFAKSSSILTLKRSSWASLPRESRTFLFFLYPLEMCNLRTVGRKTPRMIVRTPFALRIYVWDDKFCRCMWHIYLESCGIKRIFCQQRRRRNNEFSTRMKRPRFTDSFLDCSTGRYRWRENHLAKHAHYQLFRWESLANKSRKWKVRPNSIVKATPPIQLNSRNLRRINNQLGKGCPPTT